MQMNINPNIEAAYSNGDLLVNDDFYLEVFEGLKSYPKKLSSKNFYDKVGDRLFQNIMAMPEYYLTKCELDIFSTKKTELANAGF